MTSAGQRDRSWHQSVSYPCIFFKLSGDICLPQCQPLPSSIVTVTSQWICAHWAILTRNINIIRKQWKTLQVRTSFPTVHIHCKTTNILYCAFLRISNRKIDAKFIVNIRSNTLRCMHIFLEILRNFYNISLRYYPNLSHQIFVIFW